MKTKFNEVELQEINRIQEELGVSRKTAIRRFRNSPWLAEQISVDGKSAAANDVPEVTEPTKPVVRKKAKKAAEPKRLMTPKEVGAARAEGIRLFKLAGRPTKEDFIALFGPKGHKMTWAERGALAGISAEDCALATSRLVGKKAPAAVAAPKPTSTKKGTRKAKGAASNA